VEALGDKPNGELLGAKLGTSDGAPVGESLGAGSFEDEELGTLVGLPEGLCQGEEDSSVGGTVGATEGSSVGHMQVVGGELSIEEGAEDSSMDGTLV